MKKAELNKLYLRVEKNSGFQTDPRCQVLMDVRPEGDYDFQAGSGLWMRNRPAVLTVAASPGLFNPNTVAIRQRYYTESHFNARSSVWLPETLCARYGENSAEPAFTIQEKIKGERFLTRYPASNSRQKGIIAALYWNTADNFNVISKTFGELSLTMARNQEHLVSLFFGRLMHWMDLGQAAYSREKNATTLAALENDLDLIDSMIVRLKRDRIVEELISSHELQAELFFRHFGHTDLVYQKDTGRFFLPLPPERGFIVCPRFYGAAYFVWNVLMYSSGHSPNWALTETEKWRKVFETHAPSELKRSFRPGFYLNLFERTTGALLVDLPEKRSPFDRHDVCGSKKKAARKNKNARQIFRAVLEKSLQEITA